jgi:transketolase
MRDAFSNTLVSLAKADSNVLLLTGDHGYALFDAFRRECPNQYINAGIAEQNMVGMAAGLARAGFKPFVYGLAAFIPVRVIEQIKLDVAHDKLPVIFIGDGAGFVYSHLGTSHQATEDIAVTRGIANLNIYSPADRYELAASIELAYKTNLPSYIRIGKADLGDIHVGPLQLEPGNIIQVKKGDSKIYAIIATGSMLHDAGELALNLGRENVSIWSVPCIKPCDVKQIELICSEVEVIIVLEEHSIIGGLGSLVSEVSTDSFPRRIIRIGVNDRYSDKCGSYRYLKREHELDIDSIIIRLRKCLIDK